MAKYVLTVYYQKSEYGEFVDRVEFQTKKEALDYLIARDYSEPEIDKGGIYIVVIYWLEKGNEEKYFFEASKRQKKES